MRISRGLKTVEAGIDQLLAEAGELMADVTRARVALGESALAGQRPIARLSSLQQKLVEARSDIVRAHADLAKISAKQKDLPTGCPVAELTSEATQHAA
ncbi:MAG: hypothetical protein J2O44_03310 [Porphyrobacter sp.]|nr:hypothetical protein [Porphyrobacter sp.]